MKEFITAASLELMVGFVLVLILTCATLTWLLFISRGRRAMRLNIRGLGLHVTVVSAHEANTAFPKIKTDETNDSN